MEPTPNRRQFLQWSAAAMAAPALGALVPGGAAAALPAAPLRLSDERIALEWDPALRSRVGLQRHGGSPLWLTRWSAGEHVVLADGRAIERFALRSAERAALAAPDGPGTALRLVGQDDAGLEKTVEIRLLDRYPGFALLRVAYRNRGKAPVGIRAWRNCAFTRIGIGGSDGTPHFWSYNGGSYPDRRDWLQPLRRGFAQENNLGMTGSDYGGGTPIVDVWSRDGGLAVGHVESLPHLVSLPVHSLPGGDATLALEGAGVSLAPGESMQTLDSFVAAHPGDYFAALDAYRRLMAERGLQSPLPPPAAYEPIWCAWGYERECTPDRIRATLPKVRELGLDWAVIDDGWQQRIGDWNLDPRKFPGGDADMRRLVQDIRAAGLRPRLWYSPLSVVPGADLLHDHSDMLLLDKDGAVQNITWWNAFTLCPAYAPTVEQARGLVRRFLGEWGFAGLKIDGQHLNGVAPCHNPLHRHARPEESLERLHEFYRAIYEEARSIDPQAVVEICPCGTSYAFHNFPWMNQAPASDPESSWQVRLKGKTLKALMGPSAPFAGDHVELSDGGDDFASTIGIGAIVSTKFTWPVDPKPKDSFLLTAEREARWRHWIGLYRERMLPLGRYRGELYDIAFDRPEAHAVEKDGRMYYAFYAKNWAGSVALRGLGPGRWRVRDYHAGRDLGTVEGPVATLAAPFERFLLLEAIPA
jgi:alpha-galactosidase